MAGQKQIAALVFLLLLNTFLAATLHRQLSKNSSENHSPPNQTPVVAPTSPAPHRHSSTGITSNIPLRKTSSPPKTSTEVPFAKVYSWKSSEFAANLRRVGCPEETVRDIMVAEISRRYAKQEADLRPTPADHVPWGWSPKTSEAKLIERRQQAAAIAREKENLLEIALGYEVPVQMPLYAMTVSDQTFQKTLQSLPESKRNPARQAHENYWVLVEQLRSRTTGFWQREDLEELELIKAQRADIIQNLLTTQP